MFDEAAAIARWRAELARTGTLFEADLDELESHLYDRIDALADAGASREDALASAVKDLGEPRSIAREFAKVNPLLAWRAALFWIGAGVLTVLALRPVQELATHGVIAAGLALVTSGSSGRKVVTPTCPVP